MSDTESIVAVATPPGRGGIGIVRVSGPKAGFITQRIVNVAVPARQATHANFVDAEKNAIDNGIALYFPGPHSYTGEDVLELQGHGSPVIMQMLARRCLELGARLARPGEFTERAFLNGRLDLAQAEGVADLIESRTESSARSALRSLQGDFSNRVVELVDAVTRLRIFVEAAIDFPDEEIDFLEDANVVAQLEELSVLFQSLRVSLRNGKIMRDGLKVVLTGLPNAGKSSLLNALTREDRAIVSNIPGTTRDVLEQFVEIDGLSVEILDTAGIRQTTNEIEAEGVRRALLAQQAADLVILVVDNTGLHHDQIDDLIQQQLPNAPLLLVRNKIDLDGARTSLKDSTPEDKDIINRELIVDEVFVSALDGTGLDILRERIKAFAGLRDEEDNQFLARQRHIDALDRAEHFLMTGLEQQKTYKAGELLADDLHSCQKALGEITGEVTSDDLLGLIFGSFCIGK